MLLVFHLARPKSLPRKVKFHTKRPDLDNLTKAVKDGLKGVIYRDDSQVVYMRIAKRYCTVPGVSVRIKTHDEDEERYFFESQIGLDRVLCAGGMNERAGTEDLFARPNLQQDRSCENSRDTTEDPPEENQKDRAAVVGSSLRTRQY